MNEIAEPDVKGSDSWSDQEIATLGIVLRMPIDQMSSAVRTLQDMQGVRIVYTRKSVGRLKITDEQ